MKRNQKSQTYPKQRGKLFLAITLLSALLLGIVFAGLGSPWSVTAQEDNPNPPAQVVKLVFIHHSCGENWLTDDHGNLGLTLGNNNYFVSDTNYGWGPNNIGDRTDILDWPEWFNGPDSDMYLDALYNLSEQNSWYTRQLADPGGENQIVMFKSCFPNSDLEGSPGDPPSDDDYLTVGSAKRVYMDLLSYFATRQDKLFIAVTAPPLLDSTHSANARAFNNWLVHDWLRDYPYSNVAVFDFYNILTGPDNHHRFYEGAIEHVTPGGDTLYYPTDGDEHPNPTGNQKATDEFVPLLNVYYHRWQAEGPPSQPAPTQTPAVEEPGAEEPGAAAGASIDDFEGTYEPNQGWEVWAEETDTSLAFALDDEIAHSGNASLRMEFDIAPASWADFGRSFAPVQDWSDGAGLSMWLRFSGDAEAGQEMSVILFSGDPQDATPFEAWFEISPESTEWPVVSEAEGWLLVQLPWDRFLKADWAGESGLSELDLSQMVGISLSFGAPDDSRAESVVWVDDIRLLSEAGPVIDKWALWINGTQLRGANIYQRRVYPELDGLEFMGPGSLGPPYTQEDFDQLAALGANYVNISHPGLFTEEPPYILDEEVQDNLDHLLDMIAQADMFAVISFRTGPGRADFSVCCLEEAGDWYDESYLNDTVWQDPEAQDAWAAMWRYTAERYGDNPIVVGYDLMVEPNSNEVSLDLWDPEEFYAEYEGTLYDWNQMYPPVVAAIREVDPDTPIIVGGMGYSAVEWLPYVEPTEDLRTVYAIHQYAPSRYTHQWLDSLEFSYPGALDTDWDGVEDQFDRAWLDDLMSTVDAFITKYDVLVAANEFGLMRWQPGAAEFMDDQMALFEERGINYALWEWQTSWEPFAEEVHAFNFRLGPDPDNRTDVASSDLMDVITHYWGRNTIRPSNVATGKFSVLIDDFEDSDGDDRWWSYTGEGAVSFSCTPDQPGHASDQAMRLTFDLDEDGYAGCGVDVDPDLWEEATDLSFFWRADQPDLSVIVILNMQDPTQTNPETEGVTPFEAELQTPGEEWTPVTLTWDAFAKAEWVGEGGVDMLDLAQVTEVYFEVIGEQSGSVWFDDLELHKELTIPSSFLTEQVYYVAANEPGASDDNNGLYPTYQGGQDGPWLTIQHAASTMTAGATTYVRAGTYYESGIIFAHSGAPDVPITLANYESEEVIIDGAGTDDYAGIEIVEGRGHYVVQGFTIRNMPWSGIATDESTTQPYRDITIRDCILYDNGWSGIDLAAVDGFLVENVEAYDNAFYGLDIISSEDGELSAANGVVRNSSFHHHTGEEGHGMAINQGHDITISDSVAYHNTIHGFDVSDWPKRGELSHNITLERNFSYDNGVTGFAINSDSHHVVYRNNVAWRNGADWAGQGSSSGFLCYEGCWHVEWVNNVSFENTDAGFFIEEGLGTYGTPEDSLLVFKNNIAYNNGRPEWNEWRPALVVEGEAWELIATHNNWGGVPGLNAFVVDINIVGDEGDIYTTDDINDGAFQTGNISVDPQFVDATEPDVHLQPGSPCIDAGVDVGLPYLGSAPDMGAFEFEP